MPDGVRTSRPNVLVFMTDQQNGATVLDGAMPRALTPHLDAFRRRAASFSQAFAPSPHCCPSRTSFFTGLYPSEHGVWNNVNVPNALSRGPRPAVRFWSRDFRAAGYELVFSGKWHVSNTQTPSDFGWRELRPGPAAPVDTSDEEGQRRHAHDMTLLAERSVVDDGDHPRGPGEILRPGWPHYVHYGTEENPFDDESVVASALDFLADRDAEDDRAPWFCYVGTLGPHDPYTPPARFLDWYDPSDIRLPPTFGDSLADKPALYRRTRDRFDQLTEAEHRDALRHYLAFCSYEDELFGRLLASLEASGALENTIVVYLSDHGDYAGDHGLWGKGLPSFLSAYHVPMIIGGPGVDPDRYDERWAGFTSLADVGPTLLELCGLPSDSRMSGVSRAPWLVGRSQADPRPEIVLQSNGNEAYGIQRIVVTERWKLVYNMFDDDELYDRVDDPGEMSNLLDQSHRERSVGSGPLDMIPEHLREVVRDLYVRLWRFGLEHDDDNLSGYILTALASFGPGLVHSDTSSTDERGA